MQLLTYSPTLCLATSHLKPAAYASQFGQIKVESHSTLQMSPPRICLWPTFQTTSFKGSAVPPSSSSMYPSMVAGPKYPQMDHTKEGGSPRRVKSKQADLVIHNILRRLLG